MTPYARGGKATADQIQLRCHAHNQYEAVEAFGPRAPIVREHAVSYGAAMSLGPDRAELVTGPAGWLIDCLGVGCSGLSGGDA